MTRIAALFLLLAAVGCSDTVEPPPVTPPDTRGPIIRIVSPTSASYDRNSDALVDFEIAWDLRDVDTTSTVVRTIDGDSTNLLKSWRITRIDSMGLEFQETVAGLLPEGEQLLEISVADTLGNRTRDTIRLVLPRAAHAKTIVHSRNYSRAWSANAITTCEDDGSVWVAGGSEVYQIDPLNLQIIREHHANPGTTGHFQVPLCVPGDPLLYVSDEMGFIYRVDRQTGSWARPSTRLDRARIMVPSQINPELFWVGGFGGVVSKWDKTSASVIRTLDVPFVNGTGWMHAMAVTADDRKAYVSRSAESGILVVDLQTEKIVRRISLTGASEPYAGRAEDLILSPDNKFLYVAASNPAGVFKIDVRTDEIIAYSSTPNEARAIAIRKNGTSVIAGLLDPWQSGPAFNVLLDPDLRQPFQLPRTINPQVRTVVSGAAFHPTLPLAFVLRNYHTDVYLIRS